MRIIHYFPRIRLSDGGPVRAIIDICTYLAEHGHSIGIITHDAADAPKSWDTLDSLSVHVLPHSGSVLKPSTTVLSAMDQIIEGADIVHLHTPWLAWNPAIARLATRKGIPYVVSIRGMLDDWSMRQRGLKKRLYWVFRGKRFLNQASIIHSTAEAEKEQIRKWVRNTPISVVPNLLDMRQYERLPGPALAEQAFGPSADGGHTILFLSRIHEKKGIEVFIDTIAALRARGANCRGLIAGTGDPAYTRSLQLHAEKAGMLEHIHFLGLVTGDLKLSLYQLADVFLLPTHQENFGFVLPESLACGTPVVTTKGVDIWPELELSGAAVIVARNATSFAEAIIMLLERLHTDRSICEQGRRFALDWLNPQNVASQFVALYEACSA